MTAPDEPAGPLAGLLVVALEQAVAAPFATRQLADLGARVVKVERPDGGDFARSYDTAVHGQSSYLVWLNRGKQSVTLDLKSEADRSVLSGLLGAADVFVQNLGPGAADRLGLGAATLQRARRAGAGGRSAVRHQPGPAGPRCRADRAARRATRSSVHSGCDRAHQAGQTVHFGHPYRFDYRLESPLFDHQGLVVGCDDDGATWVRSAAGRRTAGGTVTTEA